MSKIFPLADQEAKDGGWTLSFEFLVEVQREVDKTDYDVSLEQIEAVLLSAPVQEILNKLKKGD